MKRRGGAVADGELHRDDRGAVLLDQALRHPAERVGGVDASGLARVEEDQPQRVVVAQVRAENGRADLGAAPVPVLEADDAVLDPVVVVVADEVEDVDVVLTQPRRERLDGRSRQPVDLHGAFNLGGQGVLHASPLVLDVELRQVGGRDDDEDAQCAVHG